MGIIRLYDFQQEAASRCVEAVLAGDNIIVSSPTGTGKSLIEIEVMRVLDTIGMTSALITSQNEIIRGIGDKAGDFGVRLTGRGSQRLWTPQKFWNRIKARKAQAPKVMVFDECLHPDTTVWTPTGVVKIGELKVGDEVLTPYGTPTRVRRVWRTVKQAVRLELRSGWEVVCSADHQWMRLHTESLAPHLRERGEPEPPKRIINEPRRVRAANAKELLRVPDFMCGVQRKVDAIAYLYGFYVGDGHVPEHTERVRFAFRKEAKIKALESVLNLFGLEGECVRKVNKRGDTIFTFSRELSRRIGARYGLVDGRKGTDILLTECVVASADLDVLRGIYDSDGWRVDARVGLSLTSKGVILQVADMLRRHGFSPHVDGPISKGDRANDAYRVMLYGADINRFNAVVGWFVEEKRQAHRVGWGRSGKLFRKDKIVSCEPVGELELVDIEVEDEEHWFVVGAGHITSNCHHGLAPTWKRYVDAGMIIVGFTATPFRGVEEEIPAWWSLFHRFHEAITITDAIQQRYLAPFYMVKETMGKLTVAGDFTSERKENEAAATAIDEHLPEIFRSVKRLDPSRPTVFIAPTVGAAQAVSKYFQFRGSAMKVVIGTTPPEERLRVFDALAAGTVWVAAVNLMTEGVDVQEIARVVNLRPSTSAIPYVQGLGRGLRPVYREGRPDWSLKADCEYVDFTTNFRRLQAGLTRMGLRFGEGAHVYYPRLDAPAEDRGLGTDALTPAGETPGQCTVSNEGVPLTDAGGPPEHFSDDLRGIVFRFAPAPVKRANARFEGRLVEADVGSTPSENWGLRFYDGDSAETYVLTGGTWVRKPTSIRPQNYSVTVSGNPDLTVSLAYSLGRSIIQDANADFSLADLLFLSFLRVNAYLKTAELRSKSESVTPKSHQKPQEILVAERFLALVPSPQVVDARSLT